MAAYGSALHNFTLSGPTLFGQVISKAAEIAGQSLSYNRNKYFVLLIITVLLLLCFCLGLSWVTYCQGNDAYLYFIMHNHLLHYLF